MPKVKLCWEEIWPFPAIVRPEDGVSVYEHPEFDLTDEQLQRLTEFIEKATDLSDWLEQNGYCPEFPL